MSVSPITSESKSLSECVSNALDGSPYPVVAVECYDVTSVAVCIDHAITIIHMQFVVRVIGIRMILVEQERAVTQFLAKHVSLVQSCDVKFTKVILRVGLTANPASQRPRPILI